MRSIHNIRVNAVDDPRCLCNNDWGPEGSTRPDRKLPIKEDTAGIALPQFGTLAIAVRAPLTTFVWGVSTNGRVVSRVRLNEGDLHVMYSPFGSSTQFNLAHELCDPADPEAMGAFRTVPDYLQIAIDPRAVLLRHFWARKFSRCQGPFEVEPFAITRTGPVRVVGAINMVSIGTRWFDSDQSVHADLGRCTIVEQGLQTRFLRPIEMYHEFESLVGADDRRVPYKVV